MSKKMFINCPECGWSMDYNETLDFICDRFFTFFGGKISKSSIMSIQILEHPKNVDGDRWVETNIMFVVHPVGTGRFHSYTLSADNGWIEKR